METRIGPPVGRRPGWASLEVARSGDAPVVFAALAAGVIADLAVRSGGALAASLLVVAAAGMLLRVGRPASRQSRALIGAAPFFAGFLAFRASPWLLPLDVVAAGGLLVLGAALARGGSLADLPLTGLAARAGHAALHGLAAPAFAGQGFRRLRARLGSGSAGGADTPGRQASWPAVLRGLALALPLLGVLGALLASSDVLFAHLFDSAPDVDDLAAHLVLIGIGAWAMAGLMRVAAATPPGAATTRFPLVGPVEASVVLGSVVVLFGAFAATQLVALAGGGRHVVETAGLTYAEYARSGFFQLVAVATIALAVLLSVDVFTGAATGAVRRRLLVLSEACVGLTLVVVAVALRRLDLYENAYGLTMLRLYAAVLAGLLGVSLTLLGVWLLTDRERAWFPAAALGAGLVALLALNLANPEALVVRRNIAFAQRSGRFDPDYLSELSADAVPELVRALPRLPAAAQADLLSELCSLSGTPHRSWASWNAADRAAVAARNRVCRGG